MRKLIFLILIISASPVFGQPIPSSLRRFIMLFDTPSTYSGQAGKILRVSDSNSVEFTSLSDLITTSAIADDSILEIDLDCTNSPTDNYILSYDLASGGFTWISSGAADEESIEDIVGGMLGGTETYITVTYQDATNDIDFVVSASGVAGAIGEGELADSIVVSADIKDDTIALADMAHADHGDVTWASGSALLDTDCVAVPEFLGSQDWGDMSTAADGTVSLDTGVVSDNEIDYSNVTLADFDYQTPWRIFYSNTDGDVTELALGANGTFLESNGASAAPAFRALEAADIPDISATYEVQLNNEAGLYAVLSDVTNFLQSADIDGTGELAAITDYETGTGALVFGTAPTFTTSITITGANADPDAAGEIVYDNSITGMTGGGIRWYDNDSARLFVDLETDPSDDDYVVAYDADADGFYMKADAGAGAAGTVTTVEDGDVQVGGADIITLDFDGTVFAITEDPDTEINIDIADDGLDSQHYAAGSIDAEHLAADIIDETKIADNGIDSEHYNDASIDHEHLAPDVISGMTDVTSEDADYILIWDNTDSALKKCDMGEVRGAAGATAWDDIADPDAAATVDFTTYTQTIDIGKSDDGGGSGLVLDVTGLGAGTDEVIALEITTATNDDPGYIPIAIYDDSGGDNDLLFCIRSGGAIMLENGGSIYNSLNNNIRFWENSDTFDMYFGGTDVDLIWSDGALNLRNNEDGVDAIVEIEGKDAGEKGILRVLSDGDDKYVEIYHDDTDGQITTNSGDLYLTATGGDINLGDDNLTTTGNVVANGNLSVGNADTTAGVLTLLEDDDDGANFASFMVPALAANTVYTLPPDDGDDTEVLQTNGAGVLTWVANAGASTAWDDIGNPDAADEIDFGAHIIELNVDDFRIGDGGDNYVKFSNTGAITFVGTADIDLPDDSVDSGDVNFNYAASSSQGGAAQDLAATDNTDMGDLDMHSIDGLYGVDDQIYIDMGANGYLDLGADTGIRMYGPVDMQANALDLDSCTVTLSTVAGTIDASSATITMPKRTKNDDRFYIFNLFNPNSIYDKDTQVCFEPNLPAAITITEVTVSCDADPATELDIDLKFADAFIGLANATLIEPIDTTNGTTDIDSGFDDATVPAGKCLYIEFGADPISTITQAIVKIRFDYD